ncbi:hypothetical protein V493_04585 [Pseudogymnoascus sp. VKM F-4281 (FW-2241)]|nr:hypothetical protein V493_04585 [Pseudogymnoascus sp. VKM F-4281 (FW-2241)]
MVRIWVHRLQDQLGVAHACVRSPNQRTGERETTGAHLRRLWDPRNPGSPCDVGVFAPLKAAYRDEAERLYRVTNAIGKKHFTYLYSPARDKAFTKRNITAAWAASGLFPFNPDRVLKTILKPLAQITIPPADEVGSCLQDEVLNSPVTPVSAEALTSLHNLIKQDQSSTQRQQRHVQKLANAAQMSFAEVALLRNQKQSLITIANESKVRRSTKL